MAERSYKIAVSGEVAQRMLLALPETQWLAPHRVSPVVLVVTVEIPEGVDPLDSETGGDAYLLEVMREEEGTFPDFRARRDQDWRVWP